MQVGLYHGAIWNFSALAQQKPNLAYVEFHLKKSLNKNVDSWKSGPRGIWTPDLLSASQAFIPAELSALDLCVLRNIGFQPYLAFAFTTQVNQLKKLFGSNMKK